MGRNSGPRLALGLIPSIFIQKTSGNGILKSNEVRNLYKKILFKMDSNMKRVLIAGATGFIGSYVTEQLLKKDFKLMLMRRQSSSLQRCQNFNDTVEWVFTDVDGWINLAETFNPDVIVNLAWDGVVSGERTLWKLQIENLIFQQTLLDIASKVGSKVFIGAGSQAEYGEIDEIVDELHPCSPNSAYGSVKLSALTILKSFCEINSIKWFWFRLFPCFGEREGDNWLIPSLIKKIMTDTSMDLTTCEQKYAYLYVGEVARVFSTAVESSADSGIYNVSSDVPISLRELLGKIRNTIKEEFVLNFGALPYRLGQSMCIVGDNRKVCDGIYRIDTSNFEVELKNTVDFYKELYGNK